MLDFRAFIYVNNIPQKDIAAYLGVSKGYISQVISGKKELSDSNLSKLVNNPHGWDVSMLTADQPENVADEKPQGGNTIDRLLGIIDSQQNELRTLIGMLREKDEEIARLREELDARKGGAAINADGSSDAAAV